MQLIEVALAEEAKIDKFNGKINLCSMQGSAELISVLVLKFGFVMQDTRAL